jgi:hypothetical protein
MKNRARSAAHFDYRLVLRKIELYSFIQAGMFEKLQVIFDSKKSRRSKKKLCELEHEARRRSASRATRSSTRESVLY